MSLGRDKNLILALYSGNSPLIYDIIGRRNEKFLRGEKMKNKKYDSLKNLALVSQIGISIITPILLGVYLGNFIDKKLGTNGVFAIILIIVGAAAGFLNIFKLTGSNDKRK